MKPWQKRLIIVIIMMICVSAGIAIILKTFNDNIVFFYSPTDLIEKSIKPGNKLIRVGGLVKNNTLIGNNSGSIEFVITDNKNDLKISYHGILPNLFKEGQASIALGRLQDNNSFIAEEILAKHDENYIPKEVVSSLNKK